MTETLTEVRLCIYVGLVMLVKNCDGAVVSAMVTSEPDAEVLTMFVSKQKAGRKTVYDIKIEIFQAVVGEKINVNIAVEKHTLDNNPAGTFSAIQEHSIKLSPPGEKHRDTLPHPSFVVDYIANDIMGLGVE